jgi:transcriptional regulator with XRE-family HTH domain
MRKTNYFGQALRRERQKIGLSIKVLAETIGISEPYLSNIETGVNPPPSSTVIDLLEAELQLESGTLFRKAIKDGYRRVPSALIAKLMGEE